jgi:cholesterol transport system auxiliary component
VILRRDALRGALAAAGVATLTGCGLSERPYAAQRQWPLFVRRPTALPPRPHGLVALVRAVQAAPGLDQRGLQTLRPDGSLDVSFYEQWIVEPAAGVEESLRQWLAASGLFTAVLAPGSRLASDIVIESTLTTFVSDLPSRVARVGLAVVAIDQRRSPAHVVAQGDPHATAPLHGSDAPTEVAALKEALASVLNDVEQLLRPVVLRPVVS